jgi:hypothetical protein
MMIAAMVIFGAVPTTSNDHRMLEISGAIIEKNCHEPLAQFFVFIHFGQVGRHV